MEDGTFTVLERERPLTNPAHRLADLFAQFTVPAGEYAEVVRARVLGVETGGNNPESLVDFWRAQGEVVDLVREVDRIVEALAREGTPVAPFRIKMPLWYQVAFSFTTAWDTKSNSHRPALSEDNLLFLRSLGTTLNFAGVAVDSPAVDHEHVIQALTDAGYLVAEASFIPAGIRQYLLQLIAEGLDVLRHYDRFGSTPARRITLMLAGGMQSVVESGAVPESERAKWRESIRSIVVSWVTAGGLALGGAIGGAALEAGNADTSPPAIIVQTDTDAGENRGK